MCVLIWLQDEGTLLPAWGTRYWILWKTISYNDDSLSDSGEQWWQTESNCQGKKYFKLWPQELPLIWSNTLCNSLTKRFITLCMEHNHRPQSARKKTTKKQSMISPSSQVPVQTKSIKSSTHIVWNSCQTLWVHIHLAGNMRPEAQ